MKVLSVENICKIKGKHEILKEVSLEVGEKEIVGFLGHNGSGKSSTIRCICGLYKLDKGKITICGHDISTEREEALSNIGVSIESPALYPQLSGKEHLQMVGNWRGVSKERIHEMEEFAGLGNYLTQKTRKYSMGMKMRLMLAITMLSKPKLIILDEPTNGLDPQGIIELRNTLLKIRDEGSSILVSSHQLSEIEKIADRVVILKQGKVVYEGIIPDKLKLTNQYYVETTANDRFLELVKKMDVEAQVISTDSGEKVEIKWDDQVTLQEILEKVVKEKIEITNIERERVTLENFYQGDYGDDYE